MMLRNLRLGRGRWLQRAAALALALVAGLAVGGAQAEDETTIRLFWWGNPDRDQRTHAVVDAYNAQNSDVKIIAEAMGWGDYWPKVATQLAGGNAPDVIQMDYRYLYEYARRGALQPLDGLVEVDDFGAAVLESGIIDDKLYAVSVGGSGFALFYNRELFEQYGVPTPETDWTWQEFSDLTLQISEASPDDVFGSTDLGGVEPVFEIWLRERGKLLYDSEGQLGFDEADLEKYFAFWNDLRKAGAVTPAEITAIGGGGDLITNTLITGASAIGFAGLNQLIGLQALADFNVEMVPFPRNEGNPSGQYVKPCCYFAISATSEHPEVAASFIEHFVTSPEAGRTLGVERGVPGSTAIQAMLMEELDDTEQEMLQYMSWLVEHGSELPPPPPTGAGEIDQLLERIYTQVAFERLSPSEGAEQFMSEAAGILERAK